VRALAANCAQCHGTDGRPAPGSRLAELAGRKREDLRALLAAFKEGRSRSTVMGQLAHGYSDAEIDALADYFARQRR
jgi:cytochrome c553